MKRTTVSARIDSSAHANSATCPTRGAVHHQWVGVFAARTPRSRPALGAADEVPGPVAREPAVVVDLLVEGVDLLEAADLVEDHPRQTLRTSSQSCATWSW